MIGIIGGGISGLAAAYELATRSVPFILLEGSNRLGGLVRTEHADGFTIDAGADSMLAAKPAAVALCGELGLLPQLLSSTPPRTAYVHARGALHALPTPSIFGIPTTLAGIENYGLLPLHARLRLAREALAAHDAGDEDISVAEFYRRNFGPETVSLIAEPLLGGIHAGDIERLSILSVAPRLVDAVREGRVHAAPGNARTEAGSGEGLFRTLRGGMGELVSAIQSRLPAGSVRLRTAAKGLSRSGGTWQILAGEETIEVRAVILAAPAHTAAQLVAPADAILARLCEEVPYVSTASVAFAWPRTSVAHDLAGSGFVVARQHSSLRITACTWVSSKWEHRAPPGMVLLRAFVGGAADPDVVNYPDESLVEVALRDVSSVLGVMGAPHLTHVQRWPHAGAQHNVGHRALLARIDARLDELPGMFLTGSGFRSIGVPDCIADGREVATRAQKL